jgi:hypothetical protein
MSVNAKARRASRRHWRSLPVALRRKLRELLKPPRRADRRAARMRWRAAHRHGRYRQTERV